MRKIKKHSACRFLHWLIAELELSPIKSALSKTKKRRESQIPLIYWSFVSIRFESVSFKVGSKIDIHKNAIGYFGSGDKCDYVSLNPSIVSKRAMLPMAEHVEQRTLQNALHFSALSSLDPNIGLCPVASAVETFEFD